MTENPTRSGLVMQLECSCEAVFSRVRAESAGRNEVQLARAAALKSGETIAREHLREMADSRERKV